MTHRSFAFFRNFNFSEFAMNANRNSGNYSMLPIETNEKLMLRHCDLTYLSERLLKGLTLQCFLHLSFPLGPVFSEVILMCRYYNFPFCISTREWSENRVRSETCLTVLTITGFGSGKFTSIMLNWYSKLSHLLLMCGCDCSLSLSLSLRVYGAISCLQSPKVGLMIGT